MSGWAIRAMERSVSLGGDHAALRIALLRLGGEDELRRRGWSIARLFLAP